MQNNVFYLYKYGCRIFNRLKVLMENLWGIQYLRRNFFFLISVGIFSYLELSNVTTKTDERKITLNKEIYQIDLLM